MQIVEQERCWRRPIVAYLQMVKLNRFSQQEANTSAAAPEMYDEKVDIWATGIVAYELLFGKTPFHGEDKTETEHLIVESSIPGFMSHLSAECRDFLQQVGPDSAQHKP